MSRTKIIANWAAGEIDNLSQAMIFRDCVIVYLAISDQTLSKVKQRLGERLLESARSDDGWIVALLFSPDSLDVINSELEIEWTDEHDEYELEEFVSQLG